MGATKSRPPFTDQTEPADLERLRSLVPGSQAPRAIPLDTSGSDLVGIAYENILERTAPVPKGFGSSPFRYPDQPWRGGDHYGHSCAWEHFCALVRPP